MIHTFGGEFIPLKNKKCIPCEGVVPALNNSQIMPLLSQIDPDWNLIADHHIERTFRFTDFQNALEFTNNAGKVCELEGHHANFELSWGQVNVIIWTHKIDGLTESDFILAAKIDDIQ